MAGDRHQDEDPALRGPEPGTWDRKEFWHLAKGWLAVLVAFGVLIAGGVFVGGRVAEWWSQFRTADDYAGPGVKDVVVAIPTGSSMNRIGQILQEAGVVKDAATFTRAARTRPDDAAQIQAGRYRLRTQIPAALALDMLLDPARLVRTRMQLPEGQRLSQQVVVMARVTKISQAEISRTLERSSAAQLGLPAWADPKRDKLKAEGFLYPDTYEIPDQPTALGVIKIPTREFGAVAKELQFEAKARQTPVKDPYDALILASIIEREVSLDADRPKVARVIYNRLAKGMRLEMDSTTAYAVNKTGSVFTTDAERKSRSPYNTYRVKGLPPGPIGAPSRKSLAAAVTPAAGDWLYFVGVNLDTGETLFAKTLAEHNVNKAKLQAWCKATPQNTKKCR